MNRYFKFKQFTISDEGCGMPISTDGVLLGAWAPLPKNGQFLDIGTGSGLLALMAAQRQSAISITAIDIDLPAIGAAQYNIHQSPWSERVTAIHQDITQWANQQTEQSITGIICNPPYFLSGDSAHQENRAIARHTLTLTFEALLRVVKHLLAPSGKASFILPVVEAQSFLRQLPVFDLYCERQQQIKTTDKKEASRLLFTITNQPISLFTEPPLTIQKKGSYSAEFKALTQAFYLKF